MKTTYYFIGIFIILFQSNTQNEYEEYQNIEIKEVFSKRVIRKDNDRIYSGQIKTQKGLKTFQKQYGIQINITDFDFEKQMLIFGITDNIKSRAFQFLTQKNSANFTLDYINTNIEFKLKKPEKGKKHSHIQVFKMKRIEKSIPHIKVKNYVNDKLSTIYE